MLHRDEIEWKRRERFAQRAFDCLSNRDADCLVDIADPREVPGSGISREEFVAYFDSTVGRRFRDFSAIVPVNLRQPVLEGNDKRFNASQDFRHPDGRQLRIYLMFNKQGRKFVLEDLSFSILDMGLRSDSSSPDGTLLKGEFWVEVRYHWFMENEEDLEQLMPHGLPVYNPRSDSYSIKPWLQFKESFKKAADLVEEPIQP